MIPPSRCNQAAAAAHPGPPLPERCCPGDAQILTWQEETKNRQGLLSVQVKISATEDGFQAVLFWGSVRSCGLAVYKRKELLCSSDAQCAFPEIALCQSEASIWFRYRLAGQDHSGSSNTHSYKHHHLLFPSVWWILSGRDDAVRPWQADLFGSRMQNKFKLWIILTNEQMSESS